MRLDLQLLPLKPDGSEEKYWVEDSNGIKYLLKFQKKDWTNVYSEHIGSKFLRLLGLDAHETTLVETDIPLGEKRVAVLCKDFTLEHGELKTFKEHADSISTDRLTHQYFFEEILYVLSKTHKISFEEISDSFWNMYVGDLILANSDRHWGNWGICKKKGKRRMSPIFDNGAGLLPRAKFHIEYTDTDEGNEKEWWRRRVYEFPNSKIMFKLPNRERSNYFEVWNSDLVPKHIKKKFIDKFNNSELSNTLDILFENEPLVSSEARKFIRKYIELRYGCIIMGHDFNSEYRLLEMRDKLKQLQSKE